MRLLIDTNVLLDVLAERPGLAQSSLDVWHLCETGQAEGIISTLSFANIVYILRKELNPDQTEDVLKILNMIFVFADLTGGDLTAAAKMKWNDFEDALQSRTAEKIKADFIVTRNLRDFQDSSVPAISPEDLLILVISRKDA